ncbi:MAG: hypothetical protein GY830_10945 [Bacteroidetes bacterium]|nr:hypothetical protein [Bacteroidota bacterium]
MLNKTLKQYIIISLFSLCLILNLIPLNLAKAENLSIQQTDDITIYSHTNENIKHKVIGNNKLKSIIRRLKSFDKIKLINTGKLIIQESDEISIKVDAEENILKYIKTEVEGNDFIIRMEIPKNTSIKLNKKIRLTLKIPFVNNLKEIYAKGYQAKITAHKIENPRKDLDIKCDNSSIEFTNDIKVKDLKIKAKGNSKINVSNLYLKKLKIDMKDHASLKLNDISCKDMHFHIEDNTKVNLNNAKIKQHAKFSLFRNSKIFINEFLAKQLKIRIHGNNNLKIKTCKLTEADFELTKNGKLFIDSFHLKELKIKMDKNSKCFIEKGNCDKAEIELSNNSKLNASNFSINKIKKLKNEDHSKIKFKK